MNHLPESDWKKFKELRELCLQRYCERVLFEVQKELNDVTKTSHERYLSIFRLTQERDEELAVLFDDSRRSMAIMQLTGMVSRDLVTEAEIDMFSDFIRERIR